MTLHVFHVLHVIYNDFTLTLHKILHEDYIQSCNYPVITAYYIKKSVPPIFVNGGYRLFLCNYYKVESIQGLPMLSSLVDQPYIRNSIALDKATITPVQVLLVPPKLLQTEWSVSFEIWQGSFRKLLSAIHLWASSYISLFISESSSSISACSPVTHLLSSVNCVQPFHFLLFLDGVSSSDSFSMTVSPSGSTRLPHHFLHSSLRRIGPHHLGHSFLIRLNGTALICVSLVFWLVHSTDRSTLSAAL